MFHDFPYAGRRPKPLAGLRLRKFSKLLDSPARGRKLVDQPHQPGHGQRGAVASARAARRVLTHKK
jgi:hypothetical protein